MSLDFDYSKTQLHDLDQGVRKAIIFYTMFVGMGSIKESNIDEFIERIRFHEKIDGPICNMDGESYSIPSDDIRKAIGLQTNVSFESRPKFVKRMTDSLWRQVRTQLRREKEKAAVEQDS